MASSPACSRGKGEINKKLTEISPLILHIFPSPLPSKQQPSFFTQRPPRVILFKSLHGSRTIQAVLLKWLYWCPAALPLSPLEWPAGCVAAALTRQPHLPPPCQGLMDEVASRDLQRPKQPDSKGVQLSVQPSGCEPVISHLEGDKNFKLSPQS